MKVTLESTTKTTELNGVRARIWEGHTESGVAVHAYITRVAVHEDSDATQFEAELAECRSPINPDIDAIPLRMIL